MLSSCTIALIIAYKLPYNQGKKIKILTVNNLYDNLYHMGMKEDFIAKAININVDRVKQWLIYYNLILFTSSNLGRSSPSQISSYFSDKNPSEISNNSAAT